MGNASFKSHVAASSRDLPMTRTSFEHNRLSNLKEIHGSYKALISSNIRSTKQTLFINDHTMKQQEHKVHGMETELVQAKNAVEQPGKGSGRLWLGYTIIGCTPRMPLYQSVLPKGRRNVP
ncbi:hypothetical protein K492DRAFT_194097 [Lichtheimia hyalospora FSU 10163]|nr:hypothetical protein K492DRAFT_194097 [Lichtheimia hyalospora FSU 10163]